MTAVPRPVESLPVDGDLAPQPRARPVWRHAAAWACIALAFALVLELTCRVEDWVMYRTPILSRVGSLDDLVVRDADGMHARPGAEFQKWKINSLGTRDESRALVPPAGTIRVITVGASETFGLRESPGREYPRQLEDTLRTLVGRSGCAATSQHRFEVLNAAFAGMSLPTIEQDVRLRLRRLRPELVVIYPTPVQYLQDEVPIAAAPDSTRNAGAVSIWNAVRPRVMARIREQIKQLLPDLVLNRLRRGEVTSELRDHPPGWRFVTLPTDRLALYDRDLRVLVRTVRAIGAEPVLVTHANIFLGRKTPDEAMLIAWEKFYPRATGKVIVAFDAAARDATLRVGADSNVVTVDAAKTFAAAPTTLFGDFVHFTDSGASLMARVVSDGVFTAANRRLGVCVAGLPRTTGPISNGAD